MNKKLIAISAMLLAAPTVILAAQFNPGPVPNAVGNITINDLVDLIFSIIWIVAVAFFIIMFIFAAFQFVTAQGDAGKVASARQFVIWGVVGVVVALLAFSIPFIVRTSLNQSGVGV